MSKQPMPKSATVLDYNLNQSGNCLAPDYFVLLFPINSMMAIILTLLMVSAIDPEEYSIFAAFMDNIDGQGGWIASFLFAFLLFFNLVMTVQVIKLCDKHGLNSSTTTKWIGQTLISGVLSWKVLKEADDSICNPKENNNLASAAGLEKCLVGPFFLTCDKLELNNAACSLKSKQNAEPPIANKQPVRQYDKKSKPTQNAPPNAQFAKYAQNVGGNVPKPRVKQNDDGYAMKPSVQQIWQNNSVNPLTQDRWPKPRPKPKAAKQINWANQKY